MAGVKLMACPACQTGPLASTAETCPRCGHKRVDLVSVSRVLRVLIGFAACLTCCVAGATLITVQSASETSIFTPIAHGIGYLAFGVAAAVFGDALK